MTVCPGSAGIQNGGVKRMSGMREYWDPSNTGRPRAEAVEHKT
jgi:hypothetical protein